MVGYFRHTGVNLNQKILKYNESNIIIIIIICLDATETKQNEDEENFIIQNFIICNNLTA
jgi:hypothetical protein